MGNRKIGMDYRRCLLFWRQRDPVGLTASEKDWLKALMSDPGMTP